MRFFSSTRAMRNAFATLAIAVAASGCYKATFMSNPNVVKGEEHDQWDSFFLWGLVGEETLDVRQFCSGSAVAQVRTGANFLTGLVSFVTLGIYAPRMAYVWCAAGTTGAAAPTALRSNAEAEPPANGSVLAIYGDGRGRPIRVELRRGGALEAVAKPHAIDAEQRHWEVALSHEVAR